MVGPLWAVVGPLWGDGGKLPPAKPLKNASEWPQNPLEKRQDANYHLLKLALADGSLHLVAFPADSGAILRRFLTV